MPKVLVVTGEFHILQLLEAKFVQEGFDVATGSDAGALEQALAEPPDLVVLEQRLAGPDGRSLVDTLRTMEPLRDVPVIVLTVRNGASGDEAALSMPFRPKQLVELAREAL